jgi:hypothetical protein
MTQNSSDIAAPERRVRAMDMAYMLSSPHIELAGDRAIATGHSPWALIAGGSEGGDRVDHHDPIEVGPTLRIAVASPGRRRRAQQRSNPAESMREARESYPHRRLNSARALVLHTTLQPSSTTMLLYEMRESAAKIVHQVGEPFSQHRAF